MSRFETVCPEQSRYFSRGGLSDEGKVTKQHFGFGCSVRHKNRPSAGGVPQRTLRVKQILRQPFQFLKQKKQEANSHERRQQYASLRSFTAFIEHLNSLLAGIS